MLQTFVTKNYQTYAAALSFMVALFGIIAFAGQSVYANTCDANAVASTRNKILEAARGESGDVATKSAQVTPFPKLNQSTLNERRVYEVKDVSAGADAKVVKISEADSAGSMRSAAQIGEDIQSGKVMGRNVFLHVRDPKTGAESILVSEIATFEKGELRMGTHRAMLRKQFGSDPDKIPEIISGGEIHVDPAGRVTQLFDGIGSYEEYLKGANELKSGLADARLEATKKLLEKNGVSVSPGFEKVHTVQQASGVTEAGHISRAQRLSNISEVYSEDTPRLMQNYQKLLHTVAHNSAGLDPATGSTFSKRFQNFLIESVGKSPQEVLGPAGRQISEAQFQRAIGQTAQTLATDIKDMVGKNADVGGSLSQRLTTAFQEARDYEQLTPAAAKKAAHDELQSDIEVLQKMIETFKAQSQ